MGSNLLLNSLRSRLGAKFNLMDSASGASAIIEKVLKSGPRLYSPACVVGAYRCLPDLFFYWESLV